MRTPEKVEILDGQIPTPSQPLEPGAYSLCAEYLFSSVVSSAADSGTFVLPMTMFLFVSLEP
jgi:hypothetical protein